MSRHWSDEELVDRLYGLAPEDGHVEECGSCGGRWQALLARRQEVLRTPAVPAAMLARQRGKIEARVKRHAAGFWTVPLAPALAALCVAIVGIFLSRPAPAPQPMVAAEDIEFYNEIYSLVDSMVPSAAEPIYGLFEEESSWQSY